MSVIEYQNEIAELRTTLEQLRIDEADPDVIEEYEAELRNLVALFDAATETFDVGAGDPALIRALDLLDYGDWTFDHVYSFVYDAAVSADLGGNELSSVVNSTDYAASLRAVLDDEDA